MQLNLKKFEEYIKLGIVKQQTPNRARAKSLVKEAEDKKKFLQTAITIIPSEKMHSNFIVDSCYDTIIELIRAKMFIDGFNSKTSHEAEVSYMQRINFSEYETKFMDELRYNRNGIKYYGSQLSKGYAEKVLDFLNKVYPKLKEIINKSEKF